MSGARVYREAFQDGIRPDPSMTLAEWGNKYRRLSQKGAAEPGPYRIERTPYLKEIAENLSPSSPVQKIVFMKSAQVGASELGFSWLGYIAHIPRGPAMMVQPTTELAEKVSKQRIASMIEETPVLAEIFGPEKSRTTGQTVLLKEYPSGVLSITGANSPVGLRSMPVRWLFFDELDAAPADLNEEGSPLALAEKRTSTFPTRKKIFVVSTPTVKDASAIEFEFEKTDQRRYFVPCPHCGQMQYLKWRNIIWADDNPKSARYKCEGCETLIEERFKSAMLAAGEWQATAESIDPLLVGYHISALYSPWATWASIVQEFLECKQDAPRLKTWVNTVLGEPFEEAAAMKLGAEGLKARAEEYSAQTLPASVVLVTAGVDVQDNRLSIQRHGWADGEECFVISNEEIFGDPEKPEVWRQLEAVLMAPVKREDGVSLKLTAACIDSGGHSTHTVYQFARQHRARQWLAIKGQSQRGKPAIGKATKVDVNFKGQVLKSGAELYPVGSDTVKSLLYGRLKHNEPGPGFVHFPDGLPDDYYQQLTSERKVTRWVKGFPIQEWTLKSGQRNEALDTFVYSYAALQFVLNQYNRATAWAQLAKKTGAKVANKAEPVINKANSGQVKSQQATIKPRRGGGGFVNSW